MSETRLQAESRTEFGKGAARRIRRDHKVPAVLYGHGTDPVHVTLPGHDTMLALKHGGANALLSIDVEGTTRLVLPKQVQRHPVKGDLEHLDLIIVRKGEKVTVDVPVHTVGEPARETLVTLENPTVAIEAEATHIPEFIEVSIEGAEAGTQIHARDLRLPEGSAIQGDEELLIVNITAEQELALEDETASEADTLSEETAGDDQETGDSDEDQSAE